MRDKLSMVQLPLYIRCAFLPIAPYWRAGQIDSFYQPQPWHNVMQSLPPQISLYTALLVISAIMLTGLALLAWHRRSAPGAGVLAVLMLALALLSLSYTCELFSATLAAKLFWVKVQYLPLLAIPTLWLIFVLQFTGQGKRLTPGWLAALAAPPTIFYLLIWAAPDLGLYYSTAVLSDSGPSSFLQLTPWRLYWLQAIYAYVLLLLATGWLFWSYLHSSGVRRAQSSLLLVAILAPLVGSVLDLFNLSPLPGLELTPVLFLVTGVVSVYALVNHRLLDLMPVAHDVLIESMIDAVAVVDDQGCVVNLNAAAQAMIGQSSDAVLGAPAAAVLPGWADLMDKLDASRTAQTQVTQEQDGVVTYWDARIAPLYQTQTKAQGWLVVYRDITTRVWAEESERQQRALTDGLRDSLSALTSILSLDEVLDRILELTTLVVPNQIGNIMLIQNGCAQVARHRGYAGHGLVRYIDQLRLPILDTANLRRMYESRQPLAIQDTRQYPGWVTLFDVEWIRSYAGAPIISKGEVIGFLNLNSLQPGCFTQQQAATLQVFADQAAIAIENAHLYASLQETNARLSRALRAREEAIQNVSHELRTPLTLMLGYTELIEAGEMGPVNDEQREALHIVAQQGQHLLFIFNSLLALQAFQQKDISLELIDLIPWLIKTTEIWRLTASASDIAIQLDVPDYLPPVMAAVSHLDLLLGNLLDNAIKFSPPGAVITISTQVEDGNILLAIADQGIGIAEEQLDLIFGRFYQIDSTTTRRFGGMGIGLALCKTIVAAHGGRIWVESPGLNQGSTFFVLLPIAPLSPGETGTSQQAVNV